MSRDIYESIYERNLYMLDYCQGNKIDPNLLEMAKQVRRDINAKTRIAEENYFLDKLDSFSKSLTKFARGVAEFFHSLQNLFESCHRYFMEL